MARCHRDGQLVPPSVLLFCFPRNGWLTDHSLWGVFKGVLNLLLGDVHSGELRACVTVSSPQSFDPNCLSPLSYEALGE